MTPDSATPDSAWWSMTACTPFEQWFFAMEPLDQPITLCRIGNNLTFRPNPDCVEVGQRIEFSSTLDFDVEVIVESSTPPTDLSKLFGQLMFRVPCSANRLPTPQPVAPGLQGFSFTIKIQRPSGGGNWSEDYYVPLKGTINVGSGG